MGTKKQICLNGHDTFVTGRFAKNGQCKVCYKDYRKKMRQSIKSGVAREFAAAFDSMRGA
jgi:hypothetical protein